MKNYQQYEVNKIVYRETYGAIYIARFQHYHFAVKDTVYTVQVNSSINPTIQEKKPTQNY